MTDVKNESGELASEYVFDVDEAMRELEKLERESRAAAAEFEDYPIPKHVIAAPWIHDVAQMGLSAIDQWRRRPQLSPGDVVRETDRAARETAVYRQRLIDERHTYAAQFHAVMGHNWHVPVGFQYWLTEGMRDAAVALHAAMPRPELAPGWSSGVGVRFSLGVGVIGLTAGFTFLGTGAGPPEVVFFIGPRFGHGGAGVSADLISVSHSPVELHQKWGGGIFLSGSVVLGLSYTNMRAPNYGEVMGDFYGLNLGVEVGGGPSYSQFFKL